jgi:hypothetical protein
MKYLLLAYIVFMNSGLLANEVLYIGDSHSHVFSQSPAQEFRRFGNVFVEKMQERGYEVSYYAACGSAPVDWVKGSSTTCGYTVISKSNFLSVLSSDFPSIGQILPSGRPLRLVINLGDNMFNWKIISGKRVGQLGKGAVAKGVGTFMELLPEVDPSNCFWIGPTYHVEGKNYVKTDLVVDEFYDQLYDFLNQKCTIIDSRPLVQVKDPSDGLHHTNSDSQKWALGVLEFL